MSDDRAMIAQFEAAQVAKFDELYGETLKNSKIQIKNIRILTGMCKRLLELDAEEFILNPTNRAQNELLHQLSQSRTQENMKRMRKIRSLRSYRRWDVVSGERSELCEVVNNPFWTQFRINLFNMIIQKAKPGVASHSTDYIIAYANLKANWAATIVENAKSLIADVNSKTPIKKRQAEELINPGNIKTLAAEYHANPTPDNAATYAKAIRALQVACPVCLDFEDFFKGKAVPQCRHAFHKTCLQDWMDRTNTCPLCRTRMTDVSLD